MKHHEIEANGISLHFVEEGQGPAVIFCHGFPAIWSSWKAQIEAVAGAGFRALAPDMRGYGKVLPLWKPKLIRPMRRLATLSRYSMRLTLRRRLSLATTLAPTLHGMLQ